MRVDDDARATFIANLSDALDQSPRSAEAVAVAAGLGKNTLYNWQNGHVTSPSVFAVAAVARELGVSVDQLLRPIGPSERLYRATALAVTAETMGITQSMIERGAGITAGEAYAALRGRAVRKAILLKIGAYLRRKVGPDYKMKATRA